MSSSPWRFSLLVLGLGFAPLALAADRVPPPDQVVLPLAAETWATAAAPRVRVGIDAVLQDAGAVAGAHGRIRKSLQALDGQADWHITRFERSQDAAGLERLRVEAEARVPEARLGNVRDRAKSVSQPGMQVRVDDIDFTPTLAEWQAAEAQARARIYAQVNDELVRLRSAFPEQRWHVHRIDFLNTARPLPAAQDKMLTRAAPAMEAAMPVMVNDLVTVNAVATLAAPEAPSVPAAPAPR